MAQLSPIEWTDATWNPTRGCSRVSEGCRNCYAERVAARFDKPNLAYEGLTTNRRWNGQIRVIDDLIEQPLRWRKPMRVFVDSMSDLFHENVPEEVLHRIYEVMERATQHTFQILTKRPERMRQYLAWRYGDGRIPARHIWHGTSIEDQQSADARVPELLATLTAVRFLSIEPLLSEVNFRWTPYAHQAVGESDREYLHRNGRVNEYEALRKINWCIVGGESGPSARPCEVKWIRLIVEQCKGAVVPCFVKQLGTRCLTNDSGYEWPNGSRIHVGKTMDDLRWVQFRDRKGGDPQEWPHDLRVREFPSEARA